MPNQNVLKVHTNFIKTELPIHRYMNKPKLKIRNKEPESELLIKGLLNDNSIYSLSEIKDYKKLLQKSNLSINSLKESIDNMIKVEKIENKIIEIYPQLSGHITNIQIKYITNKKNQKKDDHLITIEINGLSNQLSYQYLKSETGKKRYKNSDIKKFVEFVRDKHKPYNSKLEELEEEIPSLKGHIKLKPIETNKYDYYVYIYRNISNENEKFIKRNYSTLLKDKEKYKNSTFEDIYYSLLKTDERSTINKAFEEKDIKEKLGDKVKYFHSFEKERNEEKKLNKYFVIFNINGHITPKCSLVTVKKYLGLNDKEFEEKVKNGFNQRPKTDEEIELDLKNKISETIEEYNKSKEWEKKLDITTIKLIEKGETNQKNLFVIETNSGEEREFERSKVNYKQKTIKLKNDSEDLAENKNYESNGESRFRNILSQNESIKEYYDIHKEYEVEINNEKHRFDWVLINKETGKIDFIFEIDGVQHFNPKNTFENKPIDKRVRKDKTKNEFAITNGIKLFRIRYEEFNKKLSELIFDVLTTKLLFDVCSSMEISNNAKINRYIERSKSESTTKFQHKLEDIYFELNENGLLENLPQSLQNKEEFIKTLKDEINEMLIYHNNSDNIPKDEFEIYEILNYLHYNQNIKLNYYE